MGYGNPFGQGYGTAANDAEAQAAAQARANAQATYNKTGIATKWQSGNMGGVVWGNPDSPTDPYNKAIAASSGNSSSSSSSSGAGSGTTGQDISSYLSGLTGTYDTLSDKALARAKDYGKFNYGLESQASAQKYSQSLGLQQDSEASAMNLQKDSEASSTNQLGMSIAGQQRLEDTRQAGDTSRLQLQNDAAAKMQQSGFDYATATQAANRAAAIGAFRGFGGLGGGGGAGW